VPLLYAIVDVLVLALRTSMCLGGSEIVNTLLKVLGYCRSTTLKTPRIPSIVTSYVEPPLG